MNERTSVFQLILMISAGALAVVGVVTFAFFRARSADTGVPITVWGTFPQEAVDFALNDLRAQNLTKGNITYVAKTADEIDASLVEAIADNAAPDLVILEAGQMFEHSKRLIPIPYKTLSLQTMQDSFVGAGAFAGATGVSAVPLLIDPLVLYANAARLSSAGIAATPSYWDQVLSAAPAITQLGPSRSIERSAIALGEYGNVAHAKEIFFALAGQVGSRLFSREPGVGDNGETVDQYRVSLVGQQGNVSSPGVSALLFYSQFADASKEVYTWNRALPLSTEAFVAGDLGLYLGFASERLALRDQNPNLPLTINQIPQSRSSADRSTYGRFYAVALVRTTAAPTEAFAAAWTLASEPALKLLADATGLAPARRSLLDAADPSRSDQTAVYASAIMARPALQPNPEETGRVIERMMGNVSSGRTPADAAVSLAQQELALLFGSSAAGTQPTVGAN